MMVLQVLERQKLLETADGMGGHHNGGNKKAADQKVVMVVIIVVVVIVVMMTVIIEEVIMPSVKVFKSLPFAVAKPMLLHHFRPDVKLRRMFCKYCNDSRGSLQTS